MEEEEHHDNDEEEVFGTDDEPWSRGSDEDDDDYAPEGDGNGDEDEDDDDDDDDDELEEEGEDQDDDDDEGNYSNEDEDYSNKKKRKKTGKKRKNKKKQKRDHYKNLADIFEKWEPETRAENIRSSVTLLKQVVQFLVMVPILSVQFSQKPRPPIWHEVRDCYSKFAYKISRSITWYKMDSYELECEETQRKSNHQLTSKRTMISHFMGDLLTLLKEEEINMFNSSKPALRKIKKELQELRFVSKDDDVQLCFSFPNLVVLHRLLHDSADSEPVKNLACVGVRMKKELFDIDEFIESTPQEVNEVKSLEIAMYHAYFIDRYKYTIDDRLQSSFVFSVTQALHMCISLRTIFWPVFSMECHSHYGDYTFDEGKELVNTLKKFCHNTHRRDDSWSLLSRTQFNWDAASFLKALLHTASGQINTSAERCFSCCENCKCVTIIEQSSIGDGTFPINIPPNAEENNNTPSNILELLRQYHDDESVGQGSGCCQSEEGHDSNAIIKKNIVLGSLLVLHMQRFQDTDDCKGMKMNDRAVAFPQDGKIFFSVQDEDDQCYKVEAVIVHKGDTLETGVFSTVTPHCVYDAEQGNIVFDQNAYSSILRDGSDEQLGTGYIYLLVNEDYTVQHERKTFMSTSINMPSTNNVDKSESKFLPSFHEQELTQWTVRDFENFLCQQTNEREEIRLGGRTDGYSRLNRYPSTKKILFVKEKESDGEEWYKLEKFTEAEDTTGLYGKHPFLMDKICNMSQIQTSVCRNEVTHDDTVQNKYHAASWSKDCLKDLQTRVDHCTTNMLSCIDELRRKHGMKQMSATDVLGSIQEIINEENYSCIRVREQSGESEEEEEEDDDDDNNIDKDLSGIHNTKRKRDDASNGESGSTNKRSKRGGGERSEQDNTSSDTVNEWSLYLLFNEDSVKVGCTQSQSDEPGKEPRTPEEKAHSFARQYLRTTFYDDIKFYLCKIKAPMKELITVFQWEKEAKRQIKDMLIAEFGSVDEVPTSSQHSTNIEEDITSYKEALPEGESCEGHFWTFAPNKSRSEVFSLHGKNGRTLFPKLIPILDGICKSQGSTCEAYQKAYQEEQHKERENKLKQTHADEEKMLKPIFVANWKECYKGGQSQFGTTNATLSGGGSLPLDPASAYKLMFAIIRSLPLTKQEMTEQSKKLKIYWVGCGYGEEILLLALLAKRSAYPIHITAVDYERNCLDRFQENVNRLELQDHITVMLEDLYKLDNIKEEYDLMYTSACMEPMFSLKFLYLALRCPTVQYLLWNLDHCEHIEALDCDSKFEDLLDNKLWIVDAYLAKDRQQTNKDDRRIYALKLGEHDTRGSGKIDYLGNLMTEFFEKKFQQYFGKKAEQSNSTAEENYFEILPDSDVIMKMQETIAKNRRQSLSFNMGPLLFHNIDNRDVKIIVPSQTCEAYQEEHARITDCNKRKKIIHKFYYNELTDQARDIWDQQQVLKCLEEEYEEIDRTYVVRLQFIQLTQSSQSSKKKIGRPRKQRIRRSDRGRDSNAELEKEDNHDVESD